MTHLDVGRTGLAFGIFFGGLHAVWAGVVAAGWGQPLLDLIFTLHFIEPPFRVAAFRLETAALLVGLTFSIGGLSGMAFAAGWNLLARRRP